MITMNDPMQPKRRRTLAEKILRHYRNYGSFLENQGILHKRGELSHVINSMHWPTDKLREALQLGLGLSAEQLLEMLLQPYREMEL